MLTGVRHPRGSPERGRDPAHRLSDGESTDAYLAPAEQVRGEVLHEGDRLKVYVVEVRRSSRGPQVLISRTHPGLVKRLFELEVPEIYDGTVEIKLHRPGGGQPHQAGRLVRRPRTWTPSAPASAPRAPAREQRGRRAGRREDGHHQVLARTPPQYVAAALSPADVLSVAALEDGKSCRVVVPDDQLSLAIGKEGQNARLAAKLTGYKIDIKSASAAHEWEEEDALAEAERAAQAAEEAAEDAVFAEEPADGEDTLPDEAPAAEEPAEDSTEEAPAEEASNDETPAEEAPEAPEA